MIKTRRIGEPPTERTFGLYGDGGNHDQRQRLELSKPFRAWD